MNIECINNSYIKIIDDGGSQYYLNKEKFLKIIEDQKNNIKDENHYPYFYGTKELEKFYEEYPEYFV